MRPRALSKAVSTVALVAAATAVAGCSASVDAGNVSEQQTANTTGIEQQITTSLTQQSGVAPASVDCPDEMVIEEGKRYECEVVHPQDGPQRVDLTMHADGGVNFFVPGDQG